MSHTINMKEIEQKIFRAAQQDGLAELMIGIGMICVMGIVFTPTFLKTIWYLPILLLSRITESLRRRFTYSRVGQVKFQQENPKTVVGGIFLGMFVLLIIMAILFTIYGNVRDFDLWMRWFPTFSGTLLIGLFLELASKSGSGRYYAFAAFSVISGFSFSLLDFEEPLTGLGLYFLSMGIILTITGFSLFLWFLHTTPVHVEAITDGKQ